MRIRFLYNFLHINNCQEILLPGDIRGLIELDDKVLVFVCTESSKIQDGNSKSAVLAFDEHANELWKIEDFRDSNGNQETLSDLGLRQDGKVVVGTTSGIEYLVNLENGNLSLNHSTERPW